MWKLNSTALETRWLVGAASSETQSTKGTRNAEFGGTISNKKRKAIWRMAQKRIPRKEIDLNKCTKYNASVIRMI